MRITFDAAFIGNKDLCKSYLSDVDRFYVYVLCRPDGTPFYVGKGKSHRVLQHENEARHPNDRKSNAHKLNVIRSIWRSGAAVTYAIHSVHDSESDAYDSEAKLIQTWKRIHEGGILTNLAAGGGEPSERAPSSKAKHESTLGGIPGDNPERAVLNEFVLGISQMRSVVIKPESQFQVRPTIPHPSERAPTLRQAVALLAAASANGVQMNDACIIPRRVEVAGVRGFVENGVACDILKSGMASMSSNSDPKSETFVLTASQARDACGWVGYQQCKRIGLLD